MVVWIIRTHCVVLLYLRLEIYWFNLNFSSRNSDLTLGCENYFKLSNILCQNQIGWKHKRIFSNDIQRRNIGSTVRIYNGILTAGKVGEIFELDYSGISCWKLLTGSPHRRPKLFFSSVMSSSLLCRITPIFGIGVYCIPSYSLISDPFPPSSPSSPSFLFSPPPPPSSSLLPRLHHPDWYFSDCCDCSSYCNN